MMTKKDYIFLPILFLALVTVVLGEEAAFLRPSGYKSYYGQITEFSNLKSIDLCGKWRYQAKKGESWRPVDIPSSWINHAGGVKFRRSFNLDPAYSAKRLKLKLLGISRRCSIKLNGEFISHQEGPGIEIVLPPNLVRCGSDNVLEIEVDNSLDPVKTVPVLSGHLITYNYGGIFADAFIIVEDVPCLELSDVFTTVDEKGANGVIHLKGRIFTGPTEDFQGKIRCRLLASEGRLVRETEAQIEDIHNLDLSFPLRNPILWSDSQPVLYQLECQLVTEKGVSHFRNYEVGFKDFALDENGISLNGEKLQIKGVKYRQENAEGLTFKPEDYCRDLEVIKRAGANAIILTEPPHPYLLQLCDRMGLLVFPSTGIEAVPNSVLENRNFQPSAIALTRKIIDCSENHISLAGLILGMYLAPDADLGFLMKAVDFPENLPLLVSAPGRPSLLQLLKPSGEIPEAPLMVMDIGPVLPEASEQYESYQYQKTIAELESWRNAGGLFLRDFADWRGNRAILYQNLKKPSSIQISGLVERDRSPRLLYRSLEQGWFNQEAKEVVEIKPIEPLLYPILGFALVLVLVLYIRSNKVFRVQLVRVFNHPYGFYVDVRNRRFVQRMQSIILGFASTLVLALLFSALFYFLRYSTAFDYLLAHLFQGGSLHSDLLEFIRLPRWSIVYLFGIILAFFILTAVLFRLTALLCRQKLISGQTLTYIFWTAANFLVLAPMTIFFYKGLSFKALASIEIIIIALFIIWNYYRTLNALKVACSSSLAKVFILFGALEVTIIALLLVYFQNRCAFFHYFDYFLRCVM